MQYVTRLLTATGMICLLSSCGGVEGDRGLQTAPVPATGPASIGVSDFPAKVGEPYTIEGKTYTPVDVANYDDVGYASFYGQELAGRPTARGEIFNPAAITGAHKTLPLPSYVEVTALGTGRTILVRINDRGPFANDRLIDLSEGAARQLGITADGVIGVRVRKVNPPESERAVLRNGRQAATRINTPDSLLVVLRENLAKLPQPKAVVRNTAPRAVAGSIPPASGRSSGRFIREGSPASTPPRTATPIRRDGRFVRESGGPARATLPAKTGYVVQLASFSSRSRAVSLARKLGGNVQTSSDGRLFRVRYGPYASEAEAQRGLATAKQRGYPNAKIFRQ
ncbi:MAG: septal ring lytic transglycosylase RlpA family protein [Sphingorhabdus sp.]